MEPMPFYFHKLIPVIGLLETGDLCSTLVKKSNVGYSLELTNTSFGMI